MPATIPASKRFLQLYDRLTPDAQQRLVRDHLAPLLDAVPVDTRHSTIASASHLLRRCVRMPALDLKAKKAEIAALLLEITRDAKRALVKERSHREQLLAEVVDTLAKWLNDIWKVVFEFRTNFSAAHACLLFACDALDQIGNGCGGCRCTYATMFVPVHITRSTGKPVKSFSLNGAHRLETVALWVWRDLFLTMLATASKHQQTALPDMIDDIRVLLGWRALEQLLRGGSIPFCDDDPKDDDDDDPVPSRPHEDDLSEDWSSVCDDEQLPPFHASHWSWRITDEQPRLRELVHAALLDIFKVAPSGPLYSSMMAITDDEDDLEEQLHPLLMAVAGHSSDNLSAALHIMSLNDRADSIDELLTAHKHLLRSQDAASLQCAVLTLSNNYFYRTDAISIIEEELWDVVRIFHATIRFSFCNITSEINRTELRQILALGRDSLNRRTRIERWVKAILTPRVDTPHPMALAALMIGIPLPPGVNSTDEGDMLGYFELEGDDPEVQDLREEFRPNLKARLQGWADTALAIKGGPALLIKVFAKLALDMPFLMGSDVVEEMSARIADRPSKVHVSDALGAFREFCEKQGPKLGAARARRARIADAATASASASSESAPQPVLDA